MQALWLRHPVAKVIEITASSGKSIDDAVKKGLSKTAESVKNIEGARIRGIKADTRDDGTITEWRVGMHISFGVK